MTYITITALDTETINTLSSGLYWFSHASLVEVQSWPWNIKSWSLLWNFKSWSQTRLHLLLLQLF